MQVVLVYRSGGKFSGTDVKVLVRALRENGGYTGPVTCLTDSPDEVADYAHPVRLVYPDILWGWWAKMERYRTGLFTGPVLYLDLDTAILGSIEPLLRVVRTTPQPIMLESRKHPGYLATGITAWWGDQMADVYDSFIEKPVAYIEEHNHMQLGWRGPQGFVRRCIDPLKLQDFLPHGFIVFKNDYHKAGPNCSIIAWSGKPSMAHSEYPSLRAYWERFSI